MYVCVCVCVCVCVYAGVFIHIAYLLNIFIDKSLFVKKWFI